MKSTVGSPLRSSSALVATVVPIFTASMRSTGIGAPGAHAEQVADAGDRRVAVVLRVLRQQLVRDERAVGPARDDVGERAAAVDPELPAAGSLMRAEVLTRWSHRLQGLLPARHLRRTPDEPRQVLRGGLRRRFAVAAAAQTKWDMPTPYAGTNFHTENIVQFAATSTRPPAASSRSRCTPPPRSSRRTEIKRAVQGGQAQIGEILISGYSNEDPIFGVDSVPFLATSYADAAKLWKASSKATRGRASRSRG